MRCDIFSLIEMGRNKELGCFILKYVTTPYEVVILAEPKMLKLANKLLKEAANDPRLPQLITYDTTFELVDVYVSALVLRNTFVEGDPIFPVAFMLHERKFAEVHKEFFWTLHQHLDLSSLECNVPLCVDRERGITAAILSVFPKANLVYCWNHILQHVKTWIKASTGRTTDDVTVLRKHISTLLEQTTERDFDE
ncbi:unnamed protein product, partial [Allacma fusca]